MSPRYHQQKEEEMKAKEVVAEIAKHPLHQAFLDCHHVYLSPGCTAKDVDTITGKFLALYDFIRQQIIQWEEGVLRSCLRIRAGEKLAPKSRADEAEKAFWCQVKNQMPEFFDLYSKVVAAKHKT